MPDSNGLTVFNDLPEVVVFGEILAWLPAKDVFSCRGVRKSWRSGTSTPKFLTDHHRRQPSLPVILQRKYDASGAYDPRYVAFLGVGVDRKLMPVVRHANPGGDSQVALHAARDGFLIVSNRCNKGSVFCVCNPATRQCAPIPQLQRCSSRIIIAGFYRHSLSGEYRVLYWNISENVYYILKLGSGEQKCIGYPSVLSISFRRALLEEAPFYFAPVLHRDNLHWFDNSIMVFDTAVEKFRSMHRPCLEGPTGCLLEMEGMLAMCTILEGYIIKVSVLQNYELEVWHTRYQINLTAVASVHNIYSLYADLKMAIVNKRELLISFPDNLLHFDIDGKFNGKVEREGASSLSITWQLLKESIFPLPCLQMQGNGADQEPLFILGM